MIGLLDELFSVPYVRFLCPEPGTATKFDYVLKMVHSRFPGHIFNFHDLSIYCQC